MSDSSSRGRRFAFAGALTVLALLILVQAVPYGRDHTNPTVAAEPEWDSAETRELFYRACGDCHSHETRWPWYSHLAPSSWLVQRDVDEGREHFNVSMWGQGGEKDADEAAEMLREGEMPPWFYLPLHAEARLTAEEEAQLLRGLEATFGTEEGAEAREHEESEEEEHS